MEKLFAEWLKNNTNLSDSSIGKYTRAIRAITKDMIAERIIDKDLYNIKSPIEFDLLMKDIISNRFFDLKDKKGNRMYSGAMNHYSNFLKNMMTL